MKKLGFIIPVIAAVVLIGAACSNKDDKNANSASENENLNSVANTNASNTNATVKEAAEKLTVTMPAKDAVLTSPFKIEGTVAQGTIVFINLRNSAGKTLVSTTAKVVDDKWTVNAMTYKFSGKTTGDIEVYQHSTTTGGKLFDTVIPVTFN